MHVPKNAIYRNHNCAPLQAIEGMCLNGCSRRDGCGHGWKLIHPKDVLVLGARDQDANLLFAWFVRFQHSEHSPNRLFRVPEIVARDIMKLLSRDEELCKSSLLEYYLDHRLEIDATLAWQSFEAIAETRFLRIRDTLLGEEQRDKKRKRVAQITRERSKEELLDEDESIRPIGDRVPKSPEKGSGEDACAVCLEEGVANKKSCCGLSVCKVCENGLRGLCPVCDRARVNGRYVCGCCGQTVRLREFAFPCVHCEEPCLCLACYSSFEECSECEKLVFI